MGSCNMKHEIQNPYNTGRDNSQSDSNVYEFNSRGGCNKKHEKVQHEVTQFNSLYGLWTQ